MKKGFTLIELLLVIGIIAILAAIVIVAINPTRQLGQARDTARNNDVSTILSAITQYQIDNNGGFPACLNSGAAVASGAITACSGTGGSTLSESLVTALAVYVPGGLPTVDQQGTAYDVEITGADVVTVYAPGCEIDCPIEVSR